MSFYNTCFFIIKNSAENFGIAKFEMDNILNIRTEAFMKKEETQIIKAKLKAKTQTILEIGASGDFNGCRIRIKAKSSIIVQKN